LDKNIAKRKAELREQYPDSEAIGRATILDLINHKKSAGDTRQYKKTIKPDERLLLHDVLTAKDWEVYNGYVRLRLSFNIRSVTDFIEFCISYILQ